MATIEWEGVGDRGLEVDAEDFEGLSDEQIKNKLYDLVCDEALNYTHYVLPNQEDTVREIKAELSANEDAIGVDDLSFEGVRKEAV